MNILQFHLWHHSTCFVIWQLYNMFPWLAKWVKARQVILKNTEMTVRDVKDLIKHLKETLNPQICRGLVDCFLIRKQKEEVRATFSFRTKSMLNVSVLWRCGDVQSLRTLVLWILTTLRKTWYSQWPTCLLLALTPQLPHWDGLCCSWPNIQKFRVNLSLHHIELKQ